MEVGRLAGYRASELPLETGRGGTADADTAPPQGSLTTSSSEAGWSHMGRTMKVGRNTGCPCWLSVPRVMTTLHLGTCVCSKAKLGRKMTFWKLGSVQLSALHWLPAKTRKRNLQGCPSFLLASTARNRCPSFPSEGEGFENHCTHRLSISSGISLGQSSVEAA